MAQEALSSGFVKICVDTSLNALDGGCRVLVSGQASETEVGCTLEPDVLVRINNENELNCLFGQGSVLTESLRTILCECGENIDLFAIPRADPVAGVAAAYTMTITGPATSDGRFTLFFGNDTYNIDFLVEAGDTVQDIVDRLVAAVSPDFPYEAVADPVSPGSTGVIFTAKNTGIIGNYLNPIYNWAGRRNYAPAGVAVTTVLTTPGVGSPPALPLIDLLGECCYSCLGYLGPDEENQNELRDYVRDAWDCSKPQCFGHGYVFNSGSLGQVLARSDNSAELSRMAVAVDTKEFPYLALAAYIARSCCQTCENPELSIQGPEYGILNCVRIPQSCDSDWTYDERIQLQDAGFVTYGPAGSGQGALTNLMIYNDITNNLFDEFGRANVTFRDTNSRRLAAATAIQIAEHLNTYNGIALFTGNTKVREGIRGTNPVMIRASVVNWAKENVGILFSEFEDIYKDIVIQSDFATAQPCRGKPGKLNGTFRYRPPVRISDFDIQLLPKLLDNCDR